jgi:hypothetical protein
MSLEARARESQAGRLINKVEALRTHLQHYSRDAGKSEIGYMQCSLIAYIVFRNTEEGRKRTNEGATNPRADRFKVKVAH